jgi:polysaccharide export outer membrane protein
MKTRQISRWLLAQLLMSAWLALTGLLTGCQTAPQTSGAPTFSPVPSKDQNNPDEKGAPTKPDELVLHEGDTVRITFPGAPTLNAVQQIRRDGQITLPLIGEFHAAGLTPPQMEKELLTQFGPQLQSKEVVVSVDSASFPVYVNGAVLRPGKLTSDRPMTALQAVMEAGVDYNRANLKSVRVVRTENGKTEHYTLDLKEILKGKMNDEFILKPQDVIYVPEKFSWF